MKAHYIIFRDPYMFLLAVVYVSFQSRQTLSLSLSEHEHCKMSTEPRKFFYCPTAVPFLRPYLFVTFLS